jgi:hypothetical protein
MAASTDCAVNQPTQRLRLRRKCCRHLRNHYGGMREGAHHTHELGPLRAELQATRHMHSCSYYAARICIGRKL